MTDFLNALKADLLDRRLMPIVALVAVALVAAIGYAALGGGSSASTATPASAPSTSAATGIATSAADNETATAEVTSGASGQHKGLVHNPFTPLPDPKAEAATAKAEAAAKAGSSGSSSSSSGGTESGTKTTEEAVTPAKKSKKSTKPHTIYHVAVLFGEVPAGTVAGVAQLTPYENLKLLTPLPSTALPLIVYRGVTTAGKSATFTVVGEAILHGNATCLPSTSHCQAIDLAPGESEQLEYLPPSGPVVTYELRIVSISSTKASTADVHGYLAHASKAGRKVLRGKGMTAIPYLHYTSQAGVLAFAEGWSSARAHTAHKH